MAIPDYAIEKVLSLYNEKFLIDKTTSPTEVYIGFCAKADTLPTEAQHLIIRLVEQNGVIAEQVVEIEKYNQKWTERTTLAYAALNGITLSTFNVEDSIQVGGDIATIIPSNGNFPFTYEITADASDKFQITDDKLQVKNLLSVADVSYDVTIKVTDASAQESEDTFTITVTAGFTFARMVNLAHGGANTTKYFNLGNSASIQALNNNFTMSIWVENMASGNQCIASRYVSGNTLWYWRMSTTNSIELRVNGSGADYKKWNYAAQVTTSRVLLTASFNSDLTDVKLFANGVDVTPAPTHDDTFSAIRSGTTSLILGTYLALYHFNGKYGGVYIHNGTLNLAEHTELYNNGVPMCGSCHSRAGDLITWNRMFNGSDTTANFPVDIDMVDGNDALYVNGDIEDVEDI